LKFIEGGGIGKLSELRLKLMKFYEFLQFLYPKKFGLIKRRMTPDAPSNARAAITLPIMVFHLLYHSSPVPDAAISTHATMIAINDARRMTVTSILVNQSIRRGKAVSSEMVSASGFAVAFAHKACLSASEII